MTAPTLTDTPEAAMADGRCSYSSNGEHPRNIYAPYVACGRMPVVATWYAVQWPSRRRTAISALCAVHDRYAQQAVDDLPFTERMYQREAI